MASREAYVRRRLMELALLADSRPLEEIEENEEKRLIQELEEINKSR